MRSRVSNTRSTRRPVYEVRVGGGVGAVYKGRCLGKALDVYDKSVKASKSGRGRAGYKSVTLFKDGNIAGVPARK